MDLLRRQGNATLANTASTIGVASIGDVDSSHHLTFIDQSSVSGGEILKVDGGGDLSYNPSTNLLSLKKNRK